MVLSVLCPLVDCGTLVFCGCPGGFLRTLRYVPPSFQRLTRRHLGDPALCASSFEEAEREDFGGRGDM